MQFWDGARSDGERRFCDDIFAFVEIDDEKLIFNVVEGGVFFAQIFRVVPDVSDGQVGKINRRMSDADVNDAAENFLRVDRNFNEREAAEFFGGVNVPERLKETDWR